MTPAVDDERVEPRAEPASPDTSLTSTADALERRVVAAFDGVPVGGAPDEHAGALLDVMHYVGLLRQVASGIATRYSFKLELPDGRWDVAEHQLSVVPRVGDSVRLSDGGEWRILGTQVVRPRPADKPPHEFFVCAPA